VQELRGPQAAGEGPEGLVDSRAVLVARLRRARWYHAQDCT